MDTATTTTTTTNVTTLLLFSLFFFRLTCAGCDKIFNILYFKHIYKSTRTHDKSTQRQIKRNKTGSKRLRLQDECTKFKHDFYNTKKRKTHSVLKQLNIPTKTISKHEKVNGQRGVVECKCKLPRIVQTRSDYTVKNADRFNYSVYLFTQFCRHRIMPSS